MKSFLRLCLVVLPLMASGSLPGADKVSPEDFMEVLIGEVNDILLHPEQTREQKRERMLQLIDTHFDFAFVAESAVGNHAGRFNAEQRAEFDALIRLMLLNYFGQQMMFFRTKPIEIEKVGDIAFSKNAFAVTIGHYRTGFGPANRDRERTRTKYLLLPEAESWKIGRLNIAGVDVGANLRRQVGSVFNEGRTTDELLQVMRESVERPRR